MSDALINSLAAAVAGAPTDVELRALYAQRLADAGRRDDAIGQAMVVLAQQPGHPGAQDVVSRLAAPGEGAQGAADPESMQTRDERVVSEEAPQHSAEQSPQQSAERSTQQTADPGVDWPQLEREIDNPLPPPFVVEEAHELPDGGIGLALTEAEDESSPAEVTRETLRLSDVGGLEQVKRRIHETFLDPIAHPEIAKAFKKSLGGGLLLYGPPGCGKTYLARAIAGELGAHFISVTLADLLSKWLGESEGNLHKTFTEARQKAPAVLFLDEIDAVGGKRSSQTSQMLRNIVNQLLMELDGVSSDNDGLFVLAATNMPWDVDAALLRPGRFDRIVLVSPPDEPAREAILRSYLETRPIQGIDLRTLVRRTEGFSGADLKHLCDSAAEKALASSIKTHMVQPISMGDMNRALKEVRPSIGPWLDSARNVANYANTDGRYDDLVDLLKRMKRL